MDDAQTEVRDRLLYEEGVLLESIAFWKEQPDLTVYDGQRGVYNFRDTHLADLEKQLVSVRAAIHILDNPHA